MHSRRARLVLDLLSRAAMKPSIQILPVDDLDHVSGGYAMMGNQRYAQFLKSDAGRFMQHLQKTGIINDKLVATKYQGQWLKAAADQMGISMNDMNAERLRWAKANPANPTGR